VLLLQLLLLFTGHSMSLSIPSGPKGSSVESVETVHRALWSMTTTSLCLGKWTQH